jgi:hypothetical protein
MVAPSTALKISANVFTVFFIGMSFFPDKMMETYKFDLSCPPRDRSCDEKRNLGFLYSMMGFCGMQLFGFCVNCAAMARDGVSVKAQSATCFCAMIWFIVFMFNDSAYLFGGMPESIPKEGIYFNIALFAALAGLQYSAWTESGSVMPKIGSMIPSGRFAMPIIVGALNALFFGIPMVVMRETWIENWPAAADSFKALTPDLKFFALWIMGNFGKIMVMNTIMGFAIISAEPNKEDTQYRMLRGSSLVYLYFMGSMGQQTIINAIQGTPDPMRVATYLQTMAVTFYQLNSWAGVGFTLKKQA